MRFVFFQHSCIVSQTCNSTPPILKCHTRNIMKHLETSGNTCLKFKRVGHPCRGIYSFWIIAMAITRSPSSSSKTSKLNRGSKPRGMRHHCTYVNKIQHIMFQFFGIYDMILNNIFHPKENNYLPRFLRENMGLTHGIALSEAGCAKEKECHALGLTNEWWIRGVSEIGGSYRIIPPKW